MSGEKATLMGSPPWFLRFLEASVISRLSLHSHAVLEGSRTGLSRPGAVKYLRGFLATFRSKVIQMTHRTIRLRVVGTAALALAILLAPIGFGTAEAGGVPGSRGGSRP